MRPDNYPPFKIVSLNEMLKRLLPPGTVPMPAWMAADKASRAGAPWGKDELGSAMLALAQGATVEEIADIHLRTPGAIRSMLEKQGITIVGEKPHELGAFPKRVDARGPDGEMAFPPIEDPLPPLEFGAKALGKIADDLGVRKGPTPRKHAEIIKAWADGHPIEMRKFSDGRWFPVGVHSTPEFLPNFSYRVAPVKKRPTDAEIAHALKVLGSSPASSSDRAIALKVQADLIESDKPVVESKA